MVVASIGVDLGKPYQGFASQRNDSVLYGRITDRVGCPLPGVTVTASDEGGELLATATTDSRGQYELRGPSRRSLLVRAELPGFMTGRTEVILGRMPTLWDSALVVGRLADDLRTVTGTVQDSGRRAVADATITVISVPNAEVKGQVRSDSAGRFSIEFQDGGHYVVTAGALGYDLDAKPLVLVKLREAAVAFRLPKSQSCS